MQKILRRLKKFKLYDWTVVALLLLATVASFIHVMNYPKNKGKGLFQCFYNENGVLMQQNNTDRNYLTPKPAPNGACIFKPPVGIETIKITLIGGGGGGSASKVSIEDRSFNFEPEIKEYNLTDESYIVKNPFKDEIDDLIFKNKVLNNLIFQTQGGNGGRSAGSKTVPGFGGICAVGGVDINIDDEITRTLGQNGLNGENGSDGQLVIQNGDGKYIKMLATGGLGTLNITEGVKVNGTCSIDKYAKEISNTTGQDEKTKSVIQTFYNNYSVNKMLAEKRTEKIRIIKGLAGYRGEIIEFEMMNFKIPLKLCSKKTKNCHGIIGIGGNGGQINSDNTRINSSILSGKSGGDTTFLNKIAKGGLGANSRSSAVFYLTEDHLSENGEDGVFYANFAQEGAKGGDCNLGNCDGQNATTIGGSGAGGAVLYKTQTPLMTQYMVKIQDEKSRQIGGEILLNDKIEIQGTDSFLTGNGGSGMGGAIIIRW